MKSSVEHLSVSNCLNAPKYVTPDGLTGNDPLALVEVPRISLRKLAAALANPSIEFNVGVPCLWANVERERPYFRLPREGTSDVGELEERFSVAVAEAMGDAETVVVSFSGGLDSLAVMVEAARQCSQTGRSLVPLVWDLVDQTGTNALRVVEEQLPVVGGCTEPIIIPRKWSGLPEPEWSVHGPRGECHARLAWLTHEIVGRLPHPVILTGVGGDEVLGAWNYGSRRLLTVRHFNCLQHYLATFARYETVAEALGEVVSMVEWMLPRELSFRLYMAFAWRDALEPTPGDVITERFRADVQDIHRSWLTSRFALFDHFGQSWVEAMFFDQIYPFAYDAHSVDGPVPERSPYLDEQFMYYCAGLPWHVRFDASTAVPYQWYKALQMRLLPSTVRSVAPRYKMHYGREYRRYLEDVEPAKPLVLQQLGVLKTVEFCTLGEYHSYLPLQVRNLEAWVIEALWHGFDVTD